MNSLLARILKEPLFHFVLIGAAIYGLYTLSGNAEESTDPRSINISAEEVQWLTDSWSSRWNRSPTPAELDRLLTAYIEERVLANEAAAMGLDKDDAVIRRRLAQRLKFLSEDLMTPKNPDPEVLLQWFDEHIDRYREPVRYTFSQIYFDPDRRGDQVLADAEAVRDELNDSAAVVPDLTQYGDPFMLQTHYPDLTRTDLARAFGTDFSEAVIKLAPGRWVAPVLSGYGVHAVLISAVDVPDDPVFTDVAEEVRQDWMENTRRERSREFLDHLISQYEISIAEVETPPAGSDPDPAAAPATGTAILANPGSAP